VTQREYISLAVREVQRAIREGTPALLGATELPELTSVERIFTGMAKNPPQAWVMPMRSQFGAEGSLINQVHQLTVKIAVTGGEPELVGEAALRYVWAVDEAIRGWGLPTMTIGGQPTAWDARVMRVFVTEHDYGPVWEKDRTFARLPELHLAVQMSEVWG
jgi:hypothetical protein